MKRSGRRSTLEDLGATVAVTATPQQLLSKAAPGS